MILFIVAFLLFYSLGNVISLQMGSPPHLPLQLLLVKPEYPSLITLLILFTVQTNNSYPIGTYANGTRVKVSDWIPTFTLILSCHPSILI